MSMGLPACSLTAVGSCSKGGLVARRLAAAWQVVRAIAITGNALHLDSCLMIVARLPYVTGILKSGGAGPASAGRIE